MPTPKFVANQKVRLTKAYTGPNNVVRAAGDTGVIKQSYRSGDGNPYPYTYFIVFDKDGANDFTVPENVLEIA